MDLQTARALRAQGFPDWALKLGLRFPALAPVARGAARQPLFLGGTIFAAAFALWLGAAVTWGWWPVVFGSALLLAPLWLAMVIALTQGWGSDPCDLSARERRSQAAADLPDEV